MEVLYSDFLARLIHQLDRDRPRIERVVQGDFIRAVLGRGELGVRRSVVALHRRSLDGGLDAVLRRDLIGVQRHAAADLLDGDERFVRLLVVDLDDLIILVLHKDVDGAAVQAGVAGNGIQRNGVGLAGRQFSSRLIRTVDLLAGRLIVLLDLDGLLDALIGVGHSDIVHAVVLAAGVAGHSALRLDGVIGNVEQFVRLVRRLDDLAVLRHRHGLDRQLLAVLVLSLVGHIALRLGVVEGDGVAGLNSIDGAVYCAVIAVTDQNRSRIGERLARLCLHGEGLEEGGRRTLEVAVDGHIHHVIGVSDRYDLRGTCGVDLVGAVLSGDLGLTHLHIVQLVASQSEYLDLDLVCALLDILGVGIEFLAVLDALHRNGDEVRFCLDIGKGDLLGGLDLLRRQGFLQCLILRQLVVHDAGGGDGEALTLLDLEGLRAIDPIRGQIRSIHAGQLDRDVVIDCIVDELRNAGVRIALLGGQRGLSVLTNFQLPAGDRGGIDRLLLTVNAAQRHGIERLVVGLVLLGGVELDGDRRVVRNLVVELGFERVVVVGIDIDELGALAGERVALRRGRGGDGHILADLVIRLRSSVDHSARCSVDLLDGDVAGLALVGVGDRQVVDAIILGDFLTLRVNDLRRVARLAVVLGEECRVILIIGQDVGVQGFALVHRAVLRPDDCAGLVHRLVGHIAGVLRVVESDLAVFDDRVGVVCVQRAALHREAVNDRGVVRDLGADLHRGLVHGEVLHRGLLIRIERLDGDIRHDVLIQEGDGFDLLSGMQTVDVCNGNADRVAVLILIQRARCLAIAVLNVYTDHLVAGIVERIDGVRLDSRQISADMTIKIVLVLVLVYTIDEYDILNTFSCGIPDGVLVGNLLAVRLTVFGVALAIGIAQVKEILVQRQLDGDIVGRNFLAVHQRLIRLELLISAHKKRLIPGEVARHGVELDGIRRSEIRGQQLAAVQIASRGVAVQIPCKAVLHLLRQAL